MELIQLKMPPARAETIADVLEHVSNNSSDPVQRQALDEITTWLRYRLAKWAADHPGTDAD